MSSALSTAPESARSTFNDRLGDALGAAIDAGGLCERSFRVGGRTLTLRFAGPTLVEPITRALRPLAIAPAAPERAPDLTVGIWDTRSTGVDLPSCPWLLPDFFVRCDAIRHGWGERVHAAFSIKSGLLQYLDEDAPLAVAWTRDPARLQAWTRTAPLRALVAAWAEGSGACAAHAAVVGAGGEGLLLPGPSGSGKSTTALACLARGLDLVGDDFVLLDEDQAGFVAHAVYGCAKAVPAALRPEAGLGLRSAETGGEPMISEEKVVLWLDELYPRQLTTSLRLRAIVVPRLSARAETRLQPGSRAEAFRALIPPTVFMLPDVGRRTYERLAALASKLPVYSLELGPDHGRNVAALESLLARGKPDPS